MLPPITLETYNARAEAGEKAALRERKNLSNAERQRAFKNRMRENGMVQVAGWVHAHQHGDVQQLISRLASDRDLEAGPVRSQSTGKLARR